MTDYILDGHDLSPLFNLDSPSFAFGKDTEKENVPSFGSIIYTVWDSNDKFLYVGIAGTQKKPVKKRNPRSRIKEHSSGTRSGDQFCVYVQDFFVLPKIVKSGEYKPSKGYLDKLTKEYIHQNLRYRVMSFQTEDSDSIVRDLEKKIKRGVFDPPPFLNGSS